MKKTAVIYWSGTEYQFKTARHGHDQNIFFADSMFEQGGLRTFQQWTGDVVIPFADHNAEAHAFSGGDGLGVVF